MDELIRRSDAIKALRKRWARTISYDGIGEDIGEECEDVIKAVPSADRPRGELKYMGTYYKCSVCGSEFMDEITFMGELNYCPSCGARMKGADDE